MGSLPGEQGKGSRGGHPSEYGLISPGDAATILGYSLEEFVGVAALAGVPTTKFCMIRKGGWDERGQDSWGPWYRWEEVRRLPRPRLAC